MKLRELFAIVRADLDDTVEPYLWSDDFLIEAANDAEEQACRRGRLIVDSSTAACCTITLAAATARYALDPRVLFIRRAKLASGTRPLTRLSYRDLDDARPGWDSDTGDVEGFITDMDTGAIRLYRTPTAVDSLALTVVRLPLVSMTDLDDEPEIRAAYHRGLRHWIAYRAFSLPDRELKDPKKAMEHLALFADQFGPSSSALDEVWIEREQAADPFDGSF